MTSSTPFTESVHRFILDYYRYNFRETPQQFGSDPLWERLVNAGSLLWLDTGDINAATALWNSSFSALTTNNTLLNSEVQKGIYDRLIPDAVKALRAADSGINGRQLVKEIAFILNALHGLRIADRFACDVSVELHTDFAHDLEGSVACAKRFHAIDPGRFIIKLPLTPAGLIAVRRLSEIHIRVNFTLGFSARQNYAIALFSKPAFCNVFMGRLNAFVADNKLGDGKNIGEKATISTRLHLQDLRQRGLTTTQLIGASIRNGDQVAAVAGCDVLTMPPAAAKQYHDAHPSEVVVRPDADLPIALSQNVTLDDFNGSSLWDVSEPFARSSQQLASLPPESLSPDAMQRHFENVGFPDFLPRWSLQELETATRHGKIPDYALWKEKLSSGAVGLDALMNISALCAFATDQKALDSRIEKYIN
ncbi:MAG: transaldolase family protein [Chitinispirillaceae bacterium]|nr:transaldolase family protein [Chitinispirillaceae bacterium]